MGTSYDAIDLQRTWFNRTIARDLAASPNPETPMSDPETKPAPERMLAWFEYAHLPPHLQEVSRPFSELATAMVEAIAPGPERTAGLRKLLEAKDCLVRAKLRPGG